MITLVVFILFSFFAYSTTFSINNNMHQHGLLDPDGDEFLNKHLPREEWFTQKLDHFNMADEHTWSQRYWVNSTYHVDGGPAFLVLGGEVSASPLWTLVGPWVSMAKENNALYIVLEHRYYGESKPVPDTSLENLKYLNTQQALADFAYFITSMNEKYGSSISKWIVFGGSYSGTLASWLRLKYPHLVFGAVSSSGPVTAKVDYHEYFEVVKDSLASYKKECVEEVKKANIQLSNFVKTEDGRSKITKKFLLCQHLKDDENDISTLFGTLAGHFGEVVQYNKDNVGKHLSKLTIDVFCDIMTNKSSKETSLDRYAEVNKYWLSVYDYSCIDNNFQGYIEYLKPIGWDNGRQWLYQTCAEFGLFHTSSKETDLFGPRITVKFILQPCEKVFGLKFNEQFLENAVNRTNMFYGALDINVGNIIFVNGSVDPYHSAGITKVDSDKPYVVIYIEGSAHCADSYPPSPEDSVQLIEARNKIRSIVKSWVSNDKMRS